MRIRFRTLKRALVAAGLLTAAIAVPVLADYTGPDRVVSTFSWQRLVCDYEVVYDPPGSGWNGCTLTLYEPPDGNCPSPWPYFTRSACGWSVSSVCPGPYCDLNDSESIDSCNSGQPGCREVESQTTLPEATISGSISCASPGSGGWCRGGGTLDLDGSEPVAGESILALEGTHNGATFACAGSSCSVGLNEGSNDFSFWALSSFGDTSRMGNASGSQDSVDPSLSGSASGTPGDNGWYVSDVTIEASASDGTSGLASLDVRIDGGAWSSFGGPFSVGDGSHTVELRAVDGAGNTAGDSLSFDIDTQSPIADLDATPSFCPGCGETGDITIVAQDSGSGIASWSLTASGATIASGSGAIGETISWDGSGLGGGLHTLELEVRDVAGNEAGASFEVRLIEPTPVPTDEPTATRVPSATAEAPSLLSLFSVPTATAGGAPTPTSSGGPSATRTPMVVLFGGPPAASAGPLSPDPISNPQSPIAFVPAVSPALYGAAALALIASVTAVAAENLRKRREAEARQRAEMARVNAEDEAAERARAAAIAAAKAEHDLMMGQIMLQATGGESPSAEWLAAAALAAETARRMTRNEERLEPRIPPLSQIPTVKQKEKGASELGKPRPTPDETTTQPAATATPNPSASQTTSLTPLPVPIAPMVATATPHPPVASRGVSDTFPPEGFPDPREIPELALALRSGGTYRTYGGIVGWLEWGKVFSAEARTNMDAPSSSGTVMSGSTVGKLGVSQPWSQSFGPLTVAGQASPEPSLSISYRPKGILSVYPANGPGVDFSSSLRVVAEGRGLNGMWGIEFSPLDYRVTAGEGLAELPGYAGRRGIYLRANPPRMMVAVSLVIGIALVAWELLPVIGLSLPLLEGVPVR